MRARVLVLVLPLIAVMTVSGGPAPARSDAVVRTLDGHVMSTTTPADNAVTVDSEAQLRRAWADPLVTGIALDADILLRDCAAGDPIRESPYPVLVDGRGHSVRQTCYETRLLRQDGTGAVTLRAIRLSRGGADGPGGAVTTRGEITVEDSVIELNLSEGPGAGIFSMRRATIRHSRIGGNLANDDGGGVYARRGGVQVYDSVLSHNLVDGSGGAVASTGDILLVRSYVDGNTTDGDGGALYADEDGDVVVIGSLVDGSDADGPGGAIFTLDGDVAVLNSTLIGNRADDRGGAISGEADVLIVNSTLARNQAVAHVGGAAWARGSLMLVNSTVTDNYAEGEGGGVLAAGRTTLLSSTVSGNIASVAANAGSGAQLVAFGSIIGPAVTTGNTGDTRPTNRSCRVYDTLSLGYNFLTDVSCDLDSPTEVRDSDPRLQQLEDDPGGFVLRPRDDSPVRMRIPSGSCSSPLPEVIPAGHLLAPYVSWPRVLAHDAVGTVRDQGHPCDIGAVQSTAGDETARTTPFAPGPRVDFGESSDALAAPRSSRAGSADAMLIPPLDPPDADDVARTDPFLTTGAMPGGLLSLVRELAATMDRLEAESSRWPLLMSCLTYLPVDQDGDPHHEWGYRYDERDGTGIDTRTALTLHRGSGSGDLLLPRLDREPQCLSAANEQDPRDEDALDDGSRRGLLAMARALQRRVAVVEARAEDFDTWTSCATWLPVTESGDDDQELGYLSHTGADRTRYHAAIDIDRSGRDDPDYQLLAFVGPDSPHANASCDADADESDTAPVRIRPADVAAVIAELAQDIEDLAEPVAEITTFNECLYTVGVRERAGFEFVDGTGATRSRPALAFDMRGPELPQHDVLAFPGEEPPQIECDEDAEDVDDDDD